VDWREGGIEEVMIQWWDQDDINGLRLLAGELIPQFQA
jgi:hypothetical protein